MATTLKGNQLKVEIRKPPDFIDIASKSELKKISYAPYQINGNGSCIFRFTLEFSEACVFSELLPVDSRCHLVINELNENSGYSIWHFYYPAIVYDQIKSSCFDFLVGSFNRRLATNRIVPETLRTWEAQVAFDPELKNIYHDWLIDNELEWALDEES